MIGKLLCRYGKHKWIHHIGNYPGEDRWWSKYVCDRCGLEVEEE